jgi:hypothetical protein
VRTDRWFWSAPQPSRQILLAVGGAFVVTLDLINIPLTQRLLGFTGLQWQEQLFIELYAVLYVVVVTVLRRAFDATRRASRLRGGREAGSVRSRRPVAERRHVRGGGGEGRAAG